MKRRLKLHWPTYRGHKGLSSACRKPSLLCECQTQVDSHHSISSLRAVLTLGQIDGSMVTQYFNLWVSVHQIALRKQVLVRRPHNFTETSENWNWTWNSVQGYQFTQRQHGESHSTYATRKAKFNKAAEPLLSMALRLPLHRLKAVWLFSRSSSQDGRKREAGRRRSMSRVNMSPFPPWSKTALRLSWSNSTQNLWDILLPYHSDILSVPKPADSTPGWLCSLVTYPPPL